MTTLQDKLQEMENLALNKSLDVSQETKANLRAANEIAEMEYQKELAPIVMQEEALNRRIKLKEQEILNARNPHVGGNYRGLLAENMLSKNNTLTNFNEKLGENYKRALKAQDYEYKRNLSLALLHETAQEKRDKLKLLKDKAQANKESLSQSLTDELNRATFEGNNQAFADFMTPNKKAKNYGFGANFMAKTYSMAGDVFGAVASAADVVRPRVTPYDILVKGITTPELIKHNLDNERKKARVVADFFHELADEENADSLDSWEDTKSSARRKGWTDSSTLLSLARTARDGVVNPELFMMHGRLPLAFLAAAKSDEAAREEVASLARMKGYTEEEIKELIAKKSGFTTLSNLHKGLAYAALNKLEGKSLLYGLGLKGKMPYMKASTINNLGFKPHMKGNNILSKTLSGVSTSIPWALAHTARTAGNVGTRFAVGGAVEGLVERMQTAIELSSRHDMTDYEKEKALDEATIVGSLVGGGVSSIGAAPQIVRDGTVGIVNFGNDLIKNTKEKAKEKAKQWADERDAAEREATEEETHSAETNEASDESFKAKTEANDEMGQEAKKETTQDETSKETFQENTEDTKEANKQENTTEQTRTFFENLRHGGAWKAKQTFKNTKDYLGDKFSWFKGKGKEKIDEYSPHVKEKVNEFKDTAIDFAKEKFNQGKEYAGEKFNQGVDIVSAKAKDFHKYVSNRGKALYRKAPKVAKLVYSNYTMKDAVKSPITALEKTWDGLFEVAEWINNEFLTTKEGKAKALKVMQEAQKVYEKYGIKDSKERTLFQKAMRSAQALAMAKIGKDNSKKLRAFIKDFQEFYDNSAFKHLYEETTMSDVVNKAEEFYENKPINKIVYRKLVNPKYKKIYARIRAYSEKHGIKDYDKLPLFDFVEEIKRVAKNRAVSKIFRYLEINTLINDVTNMRLDGKTEQRYFERVPLRELLDILDKKAEEKDITLKDVVDGFVKDKTETKEENKDEAKENKKEEAKKTEEKSDWQSTAKETLEQGLDKGIKASKKALNKGKQGLEWALEEGRELFEPKSKDKDSPKEQDTFKQGVKKATEVFEKGVDYVTDNAIKGASRGIEFLDKLIINNIKKGLVGSKDEHKDLSEEEKKVYEAKKNEHFSKASNLAKNIVRIFGTKKEGTLNSYEKDFKNKIEEAKLLVNAYRVVIASYDEELMSKKHKAYLNEFLNIVMMDIENKNLGISSQIAILGNSKNGMPSIAEYYDALMEVTGKEAFDTTMKRLLYFQNSHRNKVIAYTEAMKKAGTIIGVDKKTGYISEFKGGAYEVSMIRRKNPRLHVVLYENNGSSVNENMKNILKSVKAELKMIDNVVESYIKKSHIYEADTNDEPEVKSEPKTETKEETTKEASGKDSETQDETTPKDASTPKLKLHSDEEPNAEKIVYEPKEEEPDYDKYGVEFNAFDFDERAQEFENETIDEARETTETKEANETKEKPKAPKKEANYTQEVFDEVMNTYYQKGDKATIKLLKDSYKSNFKNFEDKGENDLKESSKLHLNALNEAVDELLDEQVRVDSLNTNNKRYKEKAKFVSELKDIKKRYASKARNLEKQDRIENLLDLLYKDTKGAKGELLREKFKEGNTNINWQAKELTDHLKAIKSNSGLNKAYDIAYDYLGEVSRLKDSYLNRQTNTGALKRYNYMKNILALPNTKHIVLNSAIEYFTTHRKSKESTLEYLNKLLFTPISESALTDEAKKILLGEFQEGVYSNNAYESIGKVALRDLGLDFNKDKVTEQEAEAMVKELGVYGVRALYKAGLIKVARYDIKKYLKDAKNDIKAPEIVKFSFNAPNEISQSVPSFLRELNEFRESFDIESELKTYSFTPVSRSYNGGDEIYVKSLGKIKINEASAKSLNNLNHTPYIFSADESLVQLFLDDINGKEIDIDYKYKITNATQSPFAKDFSSNEGIIITRDAEWDGVKYFIKDIISKLELARKEVSAKSILNYAKEHPIYFNHTQVATGRFLNTSVTINNMSSKFHRFLFVPSSAYKEEFKIENGEVADEVFYQILAQSFGFAIDKKSSNEAIEVGKAISKLSPSELLKAKEELHLKVQVGDKSVELEAEVPTHFLMGVLAVQELRQALKENKESFNTTLVGEADAITNGVILKILQYMPIDKKYKEYLRAGGVSVNDKKYKKINEALASGADDLYKIFARSLYEEIHIKADALSGIKSAPKEFEIIDAFLEPKDGKITNVARKLAKNPFMIFAYGAGLERMTSGIIEGLFELLPETLFKQSTEPKLKQKIVEYFDYVKETYHKEVNPHKGDLEKSIEYYKEYFYTTEKTFIDPYDSVAREKFKSYLKSHLQSVFEDMFGDIMTLNEHVNENYNILTLLVNYKYALLKKKVKGELTLAQKEEFVKEALKYAPKVYRASNTKDENAYLPLFEMQKISHGWTRQVAIPASQGKNTSASVFMSEEVFGDVGARGNVYAIQQLDASIMAKTINQAKDEGVDVLGIHDAVVAGAKDIARVNHIFNANGYELSKNHTFVLDLYKDMLEFGENVKEITQAYGEDLLKKAEEEEKDQTKFFSTSTKGLRNSVKVFSVRSPANLAWLMDRIQDSHEFFNENIFNPLFLKHNKEAFFRQELVYDNVNAGIKGSEYISAKTRKPRETKAEKEFREKYVYDIKEYDGFVAFNKIYDALEDKQAYADYVKSVIKPEKYSEEVYQKALKDRRILKSYLSKSKEKKAIKIMNELDKRFRWLDAFGDALIYGNRDEIRKILSSYENGNSEEEVAEELAKDFTGDFEDHTKIFEAMQSIDAKNGYKDEAHSKELKEILKRFSMTGELPAILIKYLETNEKFHQGSYDFENKILELRVGNSVPHQRASMQETYTHEVLHAYTAMSIFHNSKYNPKNIKALKELHQTALKHIEIKDLMPEVSTGNEELDLEIATRIYNHMFKQDNLNTALAEFLAIGLTNKRVASKLKSIKMKKQGLKGDNLFELIFNLLNNLFDAMVNFFNTGVGQDKTMHQALFEVGLKISTANKRATGEINTKYESMSNFISQKLDTLDDEIKDSLDRMGVKVNEKLYNFLKEKSKDGELSGTLLDLYNLLFREGHLSKEARSELLNKLENSLSDDSLLSLLEDFRQPNEEKRIAAHFIGLSNRIDAKRNSTKDIIEANLSKFFKTPLTDKQRDDLGLVILDNDLTSLLESFSYDEVASLVKDKALRDEKINELKDKIEEFAKGSEYASVRVQPQRVLNFIQAQVDGLSHYLSTHEVMYANQLLNARNIAMLSGTKHSLEGRSEVNEEMVQAIDSLVTLLSLNKAPKELLKRTSELFEKESEGVKKILTQAMNNKLEARATIFKDSPQNQIKGYRASVAPLNIEFRVDSLANKKSLEAGGWKLHKVVDENNSALKTMGVFVRDGFVVPNKYTRGALRLNNTKHKGMAIDDIFFNQYDKVEALARIKKEKAARRAEFKDAVNAMFKGTPIKTKSPYLATFDNQGRIKTFRVANINKDFKINVLKERPDIIRSLAKESVTTYDTYTSIRHNKDLADALVKEIINREKDIKDRTIDEEGALKGHKGVKMVEISLDSTNEAHKELYQMLPDDFKTYLEAELLKHTGDKTIRIPKNLLNRYFGFRDFNIENLKWFKSMENKVLKQAILIANLIIRKLTALTKENLVVKSLNTLAGNVVSNIWQCVFNGMSLRDAVAYQIEAVYLATDYKKWYLKHEELKHKKKLGENVNQTEMDNLKQKLLNSPILPLVENGLLDGINEDLDNDSLLNDKFDEFIEKGRNKLDENGYGFVNTGLDIAFVTSKTKLNKMLFNFTTLGDFIARYALYQHNKKKGMSEKDNIYMIKDQFIDYSLPTSPLIKAMNDYGLVMFSKYYTRLQRVLTNISMNHPVRSAIGLAMTLLPGNISDPFDGSLMTKDLSNTFMMPLEVSTEHFSKFLNLPIFTATGLNKIL